jgi:hypothetical protein
MRPKSSPDFSAKHKATLQGLRQMALSKTDKPFNVTPPREEDDSGPVRLAARATFTFSDDIDDMAPEMVINTAALKTVGPVVAKTGANLSTKKKVIFFVGRGKTGKTTLIRWLSETALASDGSFLMADMDPTNDTFSKYIEGVSRPSDPSDPVLALKWLDRLLQHAIQTNMSVLVDLGGGDTTLRRLVAQLPDLVSMFEAAGFAIIVFYTVGPQEEDLSPLATLESLGLRPTATAIVLNEGLVELGEARDTAFARIVRHSAFVNAVSRGAIPVWMPKLLPAAQIEMRRLHFRDAAAGHSGQGKTPLGPFDRARVSTWLVAMEANFAGIETWLP